MSNAVVTPEEHNRPKKRGESKTDYLNVPIDRIRENPKNPRKTFDAIEDLAASIKQLGQIVPGLARPHPSEQAAYELVAGHRRFRACILAGVDAFRIVVKDMDDATALKVMLVENGQRADVPPLEEAESYRQLRDEHGISVGQIASDVGRSEAHIYQRLKLTELVPGVQELLRSGNLQVRSALLFSRLDQSAQLHALDQLKKRFEFLIEEGAVLNHKEVDHYVLLGSRKLMHARWTLDDKDLVPTAGSCLGCPKRTHAQAQLFQIGDTDSQDACLDGACWEGKVQAQADRDLAAAFETGQELIDPKDAKSLFGFGNKPVAGWLDVEHHLIWSIDRQHHQSNADRLRAIADVFPELAAHKAALEAWNLRAGAYLEENDLHQLPDDFEAEPEEPTKTWAEVIGLDHKDIRVTLDKEGHVRRLMTQADLASALWELGKKDAHKVMRPQREAPLPGSPADTSRAQNDEAWRKEKERREQRTAEAVAVREAAMNAARVLDVPELVLAVTLMVCRYGLYYREAGLVQKELHLKDGKKNRELYLEAPNAALWEHAKAGVDKKAREKERLLLALRILMERPPLEPSHDEVLRAVLGLDIKAARKTGRARRKHQATSAHE
jgi:ParB/RepB/Spo0J family partition protein